jgi:CheY-like chemotaxis protein
VNDILSRQLIEKYTQFYRIETENQSIPKDDDCMGIIVELQDDEKTFRWITEMINQNRFHSHVIACIADQSVSFKREVEVFIRPLKPHLLRQFCIEVSLHRHKTSVHEPNVSLLRVLAVDDNSANRLIIRKMLQKVGCSMRIEVDGAEAVKAVQEEQFDIILMDQYMPVLDGPAATRQIRELGLSIPIIAMTASDLPEDEAICREAGMNGFLTKPVSFKYLSELLTTFCRI